MFPCLFCTNSKEGQRAVSEIPSLDKKDSLLYVCGGFELEVPYLVLSVHTTLVGNKSTSSSINFSTTSRSQSFTHLGDLTLFTFNFMTLLEVRRIFYKNSKC